ncbi:DUF6537 domain-containing protein [Mycobacterium sp.]|uniref:DUF6537 domain-containing protein n=1 Tax=Mycobacterium sp. TaxID=1785 RepID=UPI003F946E51
MFGQDLIAYQSRPYAQHYAEFVERIRVAEATKAPGLDDLTRSVARNLHKLMAYKDEHEVPRLCLDQEVDARVREAFGSNARVSYKLHPPFLRAMGMNRKLTLGPWVRPFFRALATLSRSVVRPSPSRKLHAPAHGLLDAVSHPARNCSSLCAVRVR